MEWEQSQCPAFVFEFPHKEMALTHLLTSNWCVLWAFQNTEKNSGTSFTGTFESVYFIGVKFLVVSSLGKL